MARPRRLDALIQDPARAGIRVPEMILRILERLAVVFGRRLEPQRVHDLRKRHLDVKVILVNRVLDHPLLPNQLAFEDPGVGLELGRRTIRNSNHLPRPAAPDLVFKCGPR